MKKTKQYSLIPECLILKNGSLGAPLHGLNKIMVIKTSVTLITAIINGKSKFCFLLQI